MEFLRSRAGVIAAMVTTLVLVGPAAFAQTTETPASIATDAATELKDQFFLVMVAVIPIALLVVAAKRGYRWAKGQAR